MAARRVLCVHGSGQTAANFRHLMQPFKMAGERNGIQFFFIEGPFLHPSHYGRMWYPCPITDMRHTVLPRNVVARACEQVAEAVHKHDINALMGFSQGGSLVDTYLHHCWESPTPIQKAVIWAGYEIQLPGRRVIDVPLLSIVSPQDAIVPAEVAPRHYQDIETVVHDKGHRIVITNSFVGRICSFLKVGSSNKDTTR